MTKTVDARSLSCPQPVMLTMEALAKADEVITIVDNQAARENVARFGRNQGCEVSIEQKEEGIYLTLKKAKVESPHGEAKLAHSTVLFIGSDVIGRGELETQGVEILACGTCLSRFQLTDKVKVGRVSDMYTIADTMFKAGKVVSL